MMACALLLLVLAAPAAASDIAASVEAVSCKADELGVRSNLILAALNETLQQGASTLDAAKTAPVGTISALGQLFCIDPANVKGMKSTSFIAPSDWECQSRKEAVPWPCPKGVSSYCRYYDDERSTSRRAATALNGTDFADASDAVLAEVDDMCVRYYCYGLGANGKWSSYPPWNPGDFTDSCCEQFTHFETKVLSDATLTILGEASGTELGAFTDPGSSGWNTKVATVCGAHDDSTSITNWFKDSYWGYRHWHEDPNVEKHLIHFEINRFEMGPVGLSLS